MPISLSLYIILYLNSIQPIIIKTYNSCSFDNFIENETSDPNPVKVGYNCRLVTG